MSDWNKSVMFLLVLSLLVLLPFLIMHRRQDHRPARMLLGDDWQKMTKGERYHFVLGFRRGNSVGHHEACMNVYAMIGSPSLTDTSNLGYRCLANKRNWAWQEEYYVDQVTAFYQKYPEESTLHATNLLVLLSDGKKTIDEIHEMEKAPEQ